MKMLGCMTAGRLIATANVSASPADSEVNPLAARFQAFLAAARARFNLPDGAQMRAAFSQDPDPWSFLGRRRFFRSPPRPSGTAGSTAQWYW